MSHKNRSLLSIFLLLLFVSAGFAQRREITFNINGVISSHPNALVFIYQEQIGVAFTLSRADSIFKVFSFAVATGAILDDFDLKPDFGFDRQIDTPFAALKAHSESGAVIAYGLGINNTQNIVNLAIDRNGHFTKRWAISYPSVGDLWPELNFDDTGTRIYVLHAQAKPGTIPTPPIIQFVTKLDLIRSEDGMVIDQMPIEEGKPEAVLFNVITHKAVLTVGAFVLVLGSDPDHLSIEAKIAPPPNEPSSEPPILLATGIAISKNGRFLIAYVGHSDVASKTLFISYDLEQKTSHLLVISERGFPGVNTLTYVAATDTLFSPLFGFTTINIIALNADGVLQHTADVTLPKRSPDGAFFNAIAENNVAVSATGALGFLALNSGLLFTFDTLTGEVVDVDSKQMGPDSEHYIQLIGQLPATLAFRNGKNKLVLTDVETAPVIEEVRIKKKRARIKGTNFLAGVRVQINGNEAVMAERSLADPNHEIIINLGKKDWQDGQEITLTVINRDGLISKPFLVKK
ncbi:MAG: hypothetical protein HY231_03420 [Acidobacteria bacterium]|nr:hypothetical protein [Acidobacteriota bacterium]